MNLIIDIPQSVKFIINTLMNNGYEAYIVGGCVRDSILKKDPKDWDITTNAKPDEVINLFPKVILTGIKHGTVTVLVNKEGYEVTTYRTDGEYEDNRHPKEVEFVNSIREDLARRDFTINAMAYNEIDGLVDYFGGVADLKNEIIKTVGDPKKRFDEDALRMLRAIRFSAQLNFTIDDIVLEAINELNNNIKAISKERIREEFNKLIISCPKKIDILKECGILEYIIPGISKTYDFNQNNPYHIYNLYEHIIIATQEIGPALHLKLTMLLHDLGKLSTKTTDEKGISHYYAHARKSVLIAKSILKDLKYDNNLMYKVLKLIEYHDYPLKSKISVKKMLNKLGIDLLKDLINIQRADILAQNPIYAKDRLLNLISIESKLNLIIEKNECFNLKDLKINGQDLINLGFPKGKLIGEVLNYLLNLVIKEPILNEKEKLIVLAREKFSNKYNLDNSRQLLL